MNRKENQNWRDDTGAETYQYKLSNTGRSSAFYGNCEVCKQPVEEVWQQVEERLYTRPDGSTAWTHYKCQSYFGHKGCLKQKQR